MKFFIILIAGCLFFAVSLFLYNKSLGAIPFLLLSFYFMFLAYKANRKVTQQESCQENENMTNK